MTSNLTPKQEKFCQKFIETGNASEAYRLSYDAGGMKPTSVNRKAKELLDNVKIAARIDELRQRALKRHDVTVDSLTEELEEARSLAITTEQPAAAVSATIGKAKLHGHLSDSTKITGSLQLGGQVNVYLPDNGRGKRD